MFLQSWKQFSQKEKKVQLEILSVIHCTSRSLGLPMRLPKSESNHQSEMMQYDGKE